MTTTRRMKSLWMVALSFGAAASLTCAAQNGAPKVVELTPDACAQISLGDVLVLHWNPGFDHPGAVYGINEVQLGFLPHAQATAGGNLRGYKLLLAARPRSNDAAEPRAFVPAGNGVFDIRFHPDLQSVSPGVYDLVSSSFTPRVDSGYQGSPVQTTNDPLKYHFCLQVVSSARGSAESSQIPDGGAGR